MPEKTDEKKFEEELKKFKKQTSVENEEPTEVYNSNFMKSQNQTSRSPENKLQEVYISNPNNTNLSDTEMNDNSVACWVYVQKYVKHKTLNEMLQELPDVGQFILAMDTWFEKLMEK